MRYAIYYTPPEQSELAKKAAAWLGRDAFTGEKSAPVASGPLSAGEVAYHTASARRYGFHATLKAPFRLAPGESEQGLAAAIDAFAASATPPRCGPADGTMSPMGRSRRPWQSPRC